MKLDYADLEKAVERLANKLVSRFVVLKRPTVGMYFIRSFTALRTAKSAGLGKVYFECLTPNLVR